MGLSRMIGLWARVVLCLLGGVASLGAQFHPSVSVTDGSAACAPPRIIRIAGEHVAVATSSAGTILHANSASGLTAIPQVVQPQAHGGATIAPSAGFLQFLAYTQVEGSGGPSERDIYLASNASGQFVSAGAILNDDLDDRDPWVHVDSAGIVHVAWVSISPLGETSIRYRSGAGPVETIASGDLPQIVDLGAGEVLIGYIRDGNLHGTRRDSVALLPEQLLVDSAQDITQFRLHGGESILHVLTVEVGTLVHRCGPLGAIAGPSVVHVGSSVIGRPALDVAPDGLASTAYSAGGQLWFSRQTAGVFPPGAPLDAEFGATDPDLVIDGFGYHRIAYLSGDRVWCTNDVPPPVADFTVSFLDDTVLPVGVSFANASSGLYQSQLWEFGDGSTSTSLAPGHVYLDPGTYSITLTVTGPGGQDSVTLSGAFTATLPPNVLGIADIVAFAGQPVSHPLLASHPDPLQGYQVSIRYDDAVTPFSEVNFDGTQVDSLAPEFLVTNLNPNGAASELIIAVVFDFLDPFDGRTLDPGVDQTIANLIYTVPFGNSLGTVGLIEFIDGLGSPPITNRFASSNNGSITPYMLHGSCTVSAQPQFIFMRGDANYDLGVDISDAIFLLSYLFTGGPPPECPDSADTNDDGSLNIGDAIYGLTFLFSAGPTIPYPFPGFGIDPSEDSLDLCNPSPNP
ncbi:MAG: PKD domain-containing protein [Planctomycetota bacterium]